MHNLIFTLGVSALLANTVNNLSCTSNIIDLIALNLKMIAVSIFPIIRDSIFYVISILALIYVLWDGRIYREEALGLLLIYALYLVVIFFSKKIEKWAEDKSKF